MWMFINLFSFLKSGYAQFQYVLNMSLGLQIVTAGIRFLHRLSRPHTAFKIILHTSYEQSNQIKLLRNFITIFGLDAMN